MKPLKILHLLFNPTRKGTYWRSLHLARALVDRGHAVTVVATSQTAHFRTKKWVDRPGLTVVESPALLGGGFRFGYDPWGTVSRILWATTKSFDIVHGFECRPSVIYPALFWKTFKRTPILLDWADWFGKGGSVEQRSGWLTRTLLRPVETYYEERFRSNALGATVINPTLGTRAASLGVDPDKILDFPNGSDIRTIKPIPKAEAREILGLDPKQILIGYMGVIFKEDADLMVGAYDQVHQADPRTGLLLIGYEDISIKKMVAAPESVNRVGQIDFEKLSPYLSACDVLWLPLADSLANRGRFPLKLNDYISAGRPVVATDVGIVKQMITRHHMGVIAPADPAALAAKTLTLVHDAQRMEQLGRNARRVAVEIYQWDVIAETMEKFYERFVKA